MINIDEIFKTYKKVANILDGDSQLLDIIVNRDQIAFKCKNFVDFEKFNGLKPLMGLSPSDISIFMDNLFISYRGIEGNIDEASNEVKLLKKMIDLVSDHVCQCPVLEAVVTGYFVKIYIDKPNIKLKELAELDKIFEAEGVLETGEQRAYVIYVKDDLQ